ncbi:hypothetical protein, partial [Bilophila sp.]|uniref:hypothetical protein n=1 Tax=Bilophila sp. TaxID=1929485 RepID=UPI003077D691
SSKTFVFIESLLSVFPVGERQGPTDSFWCIGPVVFPVNKKQRVLFFMWDPFRIFPPPMGKKRDKKFPISFRTAFPH